LSKAFSLLLSGLLICSSAISFALPASAERVLAGEVCSARVHELTTEIPWFKSLKKAEQAAAEQNKLVFWVHMVGKMDGAT